MITFSRSHSSSWWTNCNSIGPLVFFLQPFSSCARCLFRRVNFFLLESKRQLSHRRSNRVNLFSVVSFSLFFLLKICMWKHEHDFSAMAANSDYPTTSDDDESLEDEKTRSSSFRNGEFQGRLFKWTNYLHGWQERYVILKHGFLNYYKNEFDIGLGCRGALSVKQALIQVENTYWVMINKTTKKTSEGLLLCRKKYFEQA